MTAHELRNLWGIMSQVYAMGEFNQERATVWLAVIGWCKAAIMEIAIYDYMASEEYKPKPATLIPYYHRAKRKYDDAHPVIVNQNCPYCQGSGWFKVRKGDNYGPTSYPCACHSERGKQVLEEALADDNFRFDPKEGAFVPVTGWIGDQQPEPSAAEIVQVQQLFAGGALPFDKGASVWRK